MNMYFVTLLCCSPIFAGAAAALYLRHLRIQDEKDEREYLKTLSEQERAAYFREKNNALLKQQKAYSINGIAGIQKSH